MGRYSVSMLESFAVCLAIGAVLGFLSGLGVGGGSLLVLWLTLVLGKEPEIARGVNLLFFLPSAAIACLFHRKQGRLDLREILPAVFAGCICAGAFSLLSARMDLELLKKLFGGLLIVTGLRELLYRPKKR